MKNGIFNWMTETQGIKIIGLLAIVLVGWVISIVDYFNNGAVIGGYATAIVTFLYVVIFGWDYLKYRKRSKKHLKN